MKILPLIATLFALALPAMADVVIYKGSAKVTLSNPQGPGLELPPGTYTANAKVTIVTDTTTLATRVVGAIKLGPGRFAYKFVDVTDVAQVGKLVVKKGKTNTVYFYGGQYQFASADTFVSRSVQLKGTETTLVVRDGEEPTTTLLPKVISGSANFAGAQGGQGGGASNVITAKYSLAATLEANDANQTVQEAAEAAAAAYWADGYNDDVQD